MVEKRVTEITYKGINPVDADSEADDTQGGEQ